MSGDAKRFRALYGSAGRHGESFWQEESNNVGVRLLKGMGWSEGQGLGKDGTGRIVAVKQTMKKDNRGIGAKADTRDEAFRASQDLFNDVLARLSGAGTDGGSRRRRVRRRRRATTWARRRRASRARSPSASSCVASAARPRRPTSPPRSTRSLGAPMAPRPPARPTVAKRRRTRRTRRARTCRCRRVGSPSPTTLRAAVRRSASSRPLLPLPAAAAPSARASPWTTKPTLPRRSRRPRTAAGGAG